MKEKIIVIGGGLAGLAASALLGKDGYKVTVLEKNSTLGGRARVFREKGFTFDMGPSWYLMPDIFERFFAKFGRKPTDFMELRRLDPQYKVFYEDGTNVSVGTNLEENLKVFESIEPGSSEKLRKYFSKTTKIYETATKGERGFLYKHFKRLVDFLDTKMIELLWHVNIFRSYDALVSDYAKSEKIKQILEYSTVFLGGSPKNIPAVYSMMTHVDFVLGGWYPVRGIGRLVDALADLAKPYDVTYVTDCNVTSIEIDQIGNARKVVTTKGDFEADIVVTSADMHHAETQLITSDKYRSYNAQYWSRQVMSPSSLLIYLGIRGKVKNLEHHNLFMINDWDRHFDTIFKNPSWPEKASYYVCCPSKTDTSVAPQGDENIFILVPVAPGLVDDDKARDRLSAHVIDDLEKRLGDSLKGRMVYKRIYSHRDFASDYNAYKGTAFAGAHTLWQSVYFRPKMLSKRVNNLYYVGQYTQPGIGMPMVILSAEFLAKEIREKYKHQP